MYCCFCGLFIELCWLSYFGYVGVWIRLLWKFVIGVFDVECFCCIFVGGWGEWVSEGDRERVRVRERVINWGVWCGGDCFCGIWCVKVGVSCVIWLNWCFIVVNLCIGCVVENWWLCEFGVVVVLWLILLWGFVGVWCVFFVFVIVWECVVDCVMGVLFCCILYIVICWNFLIGFEYVFFGLCCCWGLWNF